MKYEIKGDQLPVVICTLTKGESVTCQSGAMGWMSSNIEMQTHMSGGLGKALGRTLTGESLFLNSYTCNNTEGIIAFPSSFPGKIFAKNLGVGEYIICQKKAFLAATSSVDVSLHFKKRLGAGFFGGEGFILQKITGPGIVFLEFDGHIEEYDLASGEVMKVDTGNVAMFEPTVTFNVEMVKGLKNMLLGGEGLFLTTLQGPGKIYLQTMPLSSLASQIMAYSYKCK